MRKRSGRCRRGSPSARARDSTRCGVDDGVALGSRSDVTALVQPRGVGGRGRCSDRAGSNRSHRVNRCRQDALGLRGQPKEIIVSEVTLEERGRALENQFYEKENQEKLAAMKHKLDTKTSKDELRKASGMSDDA